MRKLSDIKFGLVGFGLFEVFIGLKLAEDAKKVMLYTPWEKPFPTPDLQDIGLGVPGIVRMDSYEDMKAEIIKDGGTFVFPDVGMGDKQLELRKMRKKDNLDFGVFGAGESGELEMNRTLFKKVLKERGLPVPIFGNLTGIDALVKFLKENKDVWIKLDVEMRGILETFHHEEWKTSIHSIDKLAHDLKYRRDTTNFMWEKPIPGEEPGDDFFIGRGKMAARGLFGYEDKGDGYSAKVSEYDDLPEVLKTVHKAMAPVFKNYDIDGAVSSEVRKGKSPEGYFIDACQRFGNPPAACIVANCKNFTRVVDSIGRREDIQPEYESKYVSELPIDTDCADVESVPFNITEKQFKSIKLRTACRLNGQYFHIPFAANGKTVAKAVGMGKTLEESQFNALEAAESFDCPGKTYSKNTFDNIIEISKRAQKYGLPKL
jgi:hypothetical protein